MSRTRWTRTLHGVALLVVLTLTSHGTDAGTVQPVTDADALLNDVVRRLPTVPLSIEGNLHVRRPRGVSVQDLGFTMELNWGGVSATAVYTIATPDGQMLERLTLSRSSDAPPVAMYTVGEAGTPRRLSDLSAPIRQTDLTWMDLTLAFLWWRGGALQGKETVRGRPAFVVDVPAPGDGPASSGYATVRLWIDERARMLLQAEGYDEEGTLVRGLWVKSFKKIDERWMIKDLEVQAYPVMHRTRVRVESVTELDGGNRVAPSDNPPPAE